MTKESNYFPYGICYLEIAYGLGAVEAVLNGDAVCCYSLTWNHKLLQKRALNHHYENLSINHSDLWILGKLGLLIL